MKCQNMLFRFFALTAILFVCFLFFYFILFFFATSQEAAGDSCGDFWQMIPKNILKLHAKINFVHPEVKSGTKRLYGVYEVAMDFEALYTGRGNISCVFN